MDNNAVSEELAVSEVLHTNNSHFKTKQTINIRQVRNPHFLKSGLVDNKKTRLVISKTLLRHLYFGQS